jgi:hypothetical protein
MSLCQDRECSTCWAERSGERRFLACDRAKITRTRTFASQGRVGKAEGLIAHSSNGELSPSCARASITDQTKIAYADVICRCVTGGESLWAELGVHSIPYGPPFPGSAKIPTAPRSPGIHSTTRISSFAYPSRCTAESTTKR